MIKIKNIFILIVIIFLLFNLLLDFSTITNQLGKDGKEFVFKYIVPFKNTNNLEAIIEVNEENINELEKSIKELTKETVLLDAQKKMFEKSFSELNENFNELNENLEELENNQITLDQYIKYFDPSELDMILQDKKIDLNYGYNASRNLYDENLVVKFYTPVGDRLLYGIANSTPGSAYLETYKDKMILVSASGILGYSKNSLNSSLLGFSLKQIQNNLKNFINVEQFKKSRHFDDPEYDWLKGGWYSIKDVEVFNENIYVSYTKEVKEDCWNTSLLVGKMNFVYIHFKTLFTSKECVNEFNNIDDEYNAHQSGGRIINLDEEILLFSIGDFRSRYRSQKEDSIFGKVLEINKKNGDYKVISMGHRNPQGLYYNQQDNFLLEAEHGPEGGDEINIIKLDHDSIQNFGWAISSYGEHYGGKNASYNKKKYVKYPLHKSHSEYGFIEPFLYFLPSIGISQIIGLNEQNKYVVASMKDESLYFFEYDNKKENQKFGQKIHSDDNKNIERIHIGERIRDMIYHDKNLYLYLEDSASIAVVIFK